MSGEQCLPTVTHQEMPREDADQKKRPRPECEPSSPRASSRPRIPHEQHREEMQRLLSDYRARMRELKAEGKRKHDMVALREFGEKKLLPKKQHGHPKGVEVGDVFEYKGEMAVMGVHSNIMSGIDANGGVAYAIVLSGCYEGDDDGGEEFVYSGTGGQLKGEPVDQSFENAWNKALRCAMNRHPIRVARKTEEKKYVYDGLYNVVKAWMEDNPGTGKKVCKFKFRGVPGESRATTKVVVGKLYASKPRLEERVKRVLEIKQMSFVRRKKSAGPEAVMQLSAPVAATQATNSRRSKKSVPKQYGYSTPNDVLKELEKDRLEVLRSKDHISCYDISGNKERLRIPAFDAIHKVSWPNDIEYVTEPVMSAAAKALIENSKRKVGSVTGCQRKTVIPYTKEGLLAESVPAGVYECPPSCTGPGCRLNRVSSCGIRYPLEIFKTPKKGYGVRCSVDIPGGAFVCEYLGELITDAEAEMVTDDSYLFALDHFLLMKQASLDGLEIPCAPEELPPVPFSDKIMKTDTFHGQYLVVNAHVKGNVGRYVNHVCGSKAQNLVIQFVVGEGNNSIFHRICFFASRDIPAGTELTYDYGYQKGSVEGRKLKCFCGSKECKGELL